MIYKVDIERVERSVRTISIAAKSQEDADRLAVTIAKSYPWTEGVVTYERLPREEDYETLRSMDDIRHGQNS